MFLPKSMLPTLLAASLLPLSLPVQADGASGLNAHANHVLLISLDGLHALDLSTYVATHSSSTLADLSAHGVTYSNATTSQPSDSFPGLAALVTGGSPITTGLWYDNTYNRELSPPMQTDGLGNPGGACPGKSVPTWLGMKRLTLT